jgi:hypothetical protein
MADTPQNTDAQSVDDLIAKSEYLDQARIEQRPAVAFNFNEPKPITNPIYPIKDHITGVSPNNYPSQVQQDLTDPVGKAKALMDLTMNKINGAQDRNRYGYAFGYDSSPKGTSRDRYKAYGQETFNKVGFSPLIDNEAWFNSNTTFGDDLSRWWNHAAWPMLSKGFMDPIKSYKSIIEGKGLFDADAQSARDYEYYNSIGQSTKGGLGGFTVNLFNSASYSAGILLEGVLESVLIEGLVGAPLPAAAGMGAGKLFNRLSQLPKSLYNSAKGTVKLAQSMQDYGQLTKAKELFKSAAGNIATFANPLANTSKMLFGQNIDNINDLARASKTAGAFWHDMMVMNLALSEGKLEGGFTKYQTYDRLYNDYMNDPKNNGLAPSLEEQENMMKEATKASFWNTLNNTALIFYSNKIVFPSLTNASFLRGAPKFGFGKVLGDINKEYQLVFNPGKKLGQATFTKEKIGLVNAIKSLARPATYGKVGLNYFKANVVEGVQESLQDVLQEATQNYYASTYKNQSARNFFYGAGLVSEAINKQFSAQGFETFASGFLMGSILQGPSKIKNYMTMGYNDYFKKDASYRQYIEERETEANEVVESMNTMWKNSDLLFDPRMTNYSTQALLYETVANPEEKTTKEIQDERYAAFQTAVISSLQRGTFDMFLNHYEKYAQATPEDIEEAWNLKPGQGAKALENFSESLENAKKIAYRWGVGKDKMKDYALDLGNYEKDSYKYKMAKIFNSAFSQSLFNYVFLQGSFDDTAGRLSKLYNKLSSISTIKNTNFAEFAVFTDSPRLQQEIEMMKTEIETLEQSGVPIAAEELNRKRKILELYSNFKEKQDKLLEAYISKEKFNVIRERIKADNPDLTEEQLSLKPIEKLIDQFEKGESNEFLEYKDSFKQLLFGLAKTEEEKLALQQEIDGMDGGFDGLYDDLLDTHILKNEKNKLAPVINLLSNPTDFYDHLLRNFQWMRHMYHNKRNIIKDIVNQEITAIERNTLLNELADRGIFVDLEEFAKWIEDPFYRPEYFIDQTNQSIIPRDGLLYDEIYELFEDAAQLESVKPAGEPQSDSETLKEIIAEITEDRDNKIDLAKEKFDKALQEKYNATEAELRKLAAQALEQIDTDISDEKSKLEAYKRFAEELELLENIRPVAVKLTESDILTNEQLVESANMIMEDEKIAKDIITLANRLVAEDPQTQNAQNPQEYAIQTAAFYYVIKPFLQDLIAEQQGIVDNYIAPDFVDVEQTEEWKKYQEELTDINNEYEELVKEAELQFIEAGGNPLDTPQYSIDNSFEDFPEELQEQLTLSFDDFLVNNLKEDISIKVDAPDKYQSLRERWLENQENASDIINDYNNKIKEEAVKKASVGLKPPKLLFGNAVIEPATPLSNITDLYMKYEEAVKTKKLELEDGTVKDLTSEEIKMIKEDMKSIAEYISTKEKAYRLKPIAQEVIENIEKNIFGRQNELVVTVDEDGFEYRTFSDAKPEDPRPERATEVASLIDQDLEEKGPFVFNKLEDGTIQNLFTEIVLNNTSDPLDDRLDSFLAALRDIGKQFKSDSKIAGIKKSLMEDQSIENLEQTIKKYSFKEASDAGINSDALIRQFLTLNPRGGFMEVPYEGSVNIRDKNVKVSDIMSKQAYNFLFHPITGSVTRFRRNMIDNGYQLYSGNVKVFDRNARDGRGVTGELDLLLIDTDGNLAVVDIKLAQYKTWKNLGVPFVMKDGKELLDQDGNKIKNIGNRKTYFRGQQTVYQYSIYNMSGIDADILLYPIEMEVTMDGYINKLSYPTTDLSKHNKLSENGMFIILEPIDEGTMARFGFNKVKPDVTTTTPTEPGSVIPAGSVPVSDPEKSTLNDFLNQQVMYMGYVGTLITNSDGGFSVELDRDGKIGIYDLNFEGKNVKDGSLNIIQVGLSPVTADVEVLGQVTQIAGKTINAKFLDRNEKTAEIDGVKYTVNRDSTGAIVSLTYNTNDKEISKTQNEIEEVNREIKDLEEQKKVSKNRNLDREITKKRFELNRLNTKKADLINKNKKRTLRGGNTNDLIFALNRLPNRFQKQVPSNLPTDREDQVKLIGQLSESERITKEIDRILAEHGTTQDVEDIFSGKLDDLSPKKVNAITDWAVELVIKLEEYQSRLVNEGSSTIPVDNVIGAVNETINNIGLIKFFKNGKITKTSRKEFERRTKVQQSTNVPIVQKSSGTTTEGVSGQAVSREELSKIIEQSRQKITGIQIDETEDEESIEGLDETFAEIEALFENATLDNIDQIYADAVAKYVFNIGIYTGITDAINDAYLNKIESLEKDLSFENINEGSVLINIQPIGTNKRLNQNFIFDSKDETNRTVTLYNPVRKKNFTFTEEELKEKFMLPRDEAAPIEEMNVTPIIKENIKSTTENVQNLVKDAEQLQKLEEESKNMTKEDRQNNLRNNFNLC